MARRRKNEETLALDSLLDILSNVVGVMVLITVITVLNTNNIQIRLGTPKSRDASESAERIYFEVRGNRINVIDEAEINAVVDDFRVNKNLLNLRAARLATTINRANLQSNHYKIRTVAQEGELVKILEQRDTPTGERIGEFSQPNSAYAEILKTLDPEKNYLFFIVRADSFEAFRAARTMAREFPYGVSFESSDPTQFPTTPPTAPSSEMQTGWFPMTVGQPLQFGASGLGGQVQ